ncbi:MAG TPA: glycosyl hydrolase 115 family protein, partial [Paraburkholderia sp.]|uniref:glycosyl hydrolase 115 family protein n=1 Tax=Paraburkholderia sp. TaxID=1926495 RepID=UPI002B493D43
MSKYLQGSKECVIIQSNASDVLVFQDAQLLPSDEKISRDNMYAKLLNILPLLAAFGMSVAAAEPFPLTQQGVATIVHEDNKTLSLVASMLGRDLRNVAGVSTVSATNLADCRRLCIVVGSADSALVRDLARVGRVDLSPLRGQWERYVRTAVDDKSGRRILLIAGSDKRGALYGVVDLSRELGVSPWEWWADVAPARNDKAAVDGAWKLSAGPSVQYRGIFLNDEDWGLQPWAAGKDPTKDIGPTTYARIFELLWRLKANLIWPAMHDSTKPFYQIPGNARTAEDYAIVVGTSHAEPMMRNNVREWDAGRRGAFNFFNNRDAMLNYWQERVDEVKDYENIYSVGLRGVHDSAMEGADTIEKARSATGEVIGLQRNMLSRSLGRPPQRIPQALTLYKEVLDVYKAGLNVPEDITLVWPDDNYGYLHQLSNAAERKRTGGAGIYYHLSYWGRPHDYLWLGTTHPALIRDQLQRAWASGARKLWVVNVGDIKPLEYLTQYFLESAFDASKLDHDTQQDLTTWSAAQFGAHLAPAVSGIMRAYYDLAWERRPEFMGFGQIEPTTPNRRTAYMESGGEEAWRRLELYQVLVAQAERLASE